MHLSIRILGAEVLAIDMGPGEPGLEVDQGEATATLFGFVPSPDEPTWDLGVER